MKTIKRVLSAVLVLLTVISIVPIVNFSVSAGVTLVWPVPGHTQLSQGWHDGNAIDINDSNINGATVVAAIGGTVNRIYYCNETHASYGDCSGFGTGVVILGDDNRLYQYAHMQGGSIPSNVYYGARVEAGQIIGKVGSTGWSTGPHLHFAIANSTTNPWAQGVNPLNESYTYLLDSAPSYCSLSINKENLLIGEEFTLSATSDIYSNYYISIFDMDSGEIVDNGNMEVNTYTNAFQKAGHYGAYITAYNSYGSVDSKWIHFYVFGDKPTVAQLKVNKETIYLGEQVTLITSSDAFYVKIYISIFDASDNKVYEGNIPYSFDYVSASIGRYSCYVTAYTHEGGVDSNWVSFTVEEHVHEYSSEEVLQPTCIEDGIIKFKCSCGDSYTETVTATGIHDFGDWSETKAPTTTETGEETRTCTVCSETETREIPMLTASLKISIDNYIVTITEAEQITAMRYAAGEHTTTASIKNALDRVDLSASIIAKNTVDGNFVYEMPDGGYYTFWVRMSDGTEYLLAADMTKFIPSVDTYGVKVTVNGLYDVKDFFIAKGKFNNYNEIKNNGYIVRLTSNKIADKHNYTYTVTDPGMHTILVRYNDGSEYIFHEELTVDEPVFTTNGLQVTISNIPDVKVIRTAYGEYYTPGDTKRAEGARNFSNKSVIKNADEYMIQYRNEGIVTIIVEYNNGYVKVFHYNVEMKRANCMQAMSSVIFDNLDGFVMIRYAMGEYATSAEIKRAPGSKVIKPADITDGRAVISGLAKGTYTFCVQFDDDSYNYYTVTVE